jgi:hypothetical protein
MAIQDYEWLIGVGLVVVSCAVSNLGLNIQKLFHIRQANLQKQQSLNQLETELVHGLKSDEVHPVAEKKKKQKGDDYCRQPLWICGFSLVLIGSLLDFAALGFAAQTVIAPLGSLTLVTNVWFAPYFNGEQATRKDMIATAFIVIGSATAVGFADHSEVDLSYVVVSFE